MLSCTSAPLARFVGRPFYDLPAVLEAMRRMYQLSVVDGFEFQNVAEWDAENPPHDDGESRLGYWADSAKYSVDEIAAALREAQVPILSIHANRDVGILLCSGEAADVAKGKRLMHESLSLAERAGAQACVFHFWDTWKEDFDLAFLHQVMAEIAPHYPGVRATVENVPTHLPGRTPLDLVSEFEWITLDWRWAARYDQWAGFAALSRRIANVHLHGRVQQGRWILDPTWPWAQRDDFYRALQATRDQWEYTGLWTVERVPPDIAWEDFVAAIVSLRSVLCQAGR